MRLNASVTLLAIILVTSSLLGFVAFNIREVKAAPANILVDSYPGTWNQTGTVGSTVRYFVNITGITELWSFDFTLAWGMTVLEFKSRTLRIPKSTYADGILNAPNFKVYESGVSVSNPESNRTAVYRLAYTEQGAATPFTGSGCAVYLDFVVLSPGGECDVYFVDSLLGFKNGTAIAHTRTDGYFYQPTKKRVPTASFTTSPATKIANKTSVTFNGAGSSDPDAGGGITSYIWNLGQDKPKIPAIESAHPYLPNTNVQFPLTHTNAIRMRVFFPNITTESTKDFVRVKDKNLIQINSWSGSLVNIWSNWAKGDTLYINFTSDGANQFWGFKADHYNFFLQVTTTTTTYTYTILESDYGAAPYGPYPFTASLSVVDLENSQSKTVRNAVQVVHPRPVAAFTFSPNVAHYYHGNSYIFGGKTVTFDASGSYDPDGLPIVWYAWDFGDGRKDNKTSPTTSYNFRHEGGVMQISLTIEDAEGLQNFIYTRIYVYNMTEFARSYGSTPSSSNWNYFYDINFDNIVNAIDLYIVGRSYY
jgi:hypothetical protein